MTDSTELLTEPEAGALPAGYPGRVAAWIHACRIPTLSAAVIPVLVGTVLAWRHGDFSLVTAIATLVGAVAIQIGTNLANDLYDFKKGADSPARLGPPRVLARGWLSTDDVTAGMVAAFGIATASGAYLIAVAGWPILAIGVASIAAGILYTAGPFALAYVGLGDLFVFLFFGLVAVLGTYYAQARGLDPEAWVAAIPVGTLATAILVVNNLRDIDTDRAAGKLTLAARLGRRATRLEFATLLLAAFAVPIALWAQGLSSAWVLLPLATTTLAARTLQAVFEKTDGPGLNRTLVDTAQLHLLFGLLFAVGLALG